MHSVHGKNKAALEHLWSMIINMVLNFPCVSSPVIKSIVTTWKGGVFSLVGIQYSSVCFLCMRIFDCWQVAHPFMYSATHSFMPGHQ